MIVISWTTFVHIMKPVDTNHGIVACTKSLREYHNIISLKAINPENLKTDWTVVFDTEQHETLFLIKYGEYM